MTHSVGAASNGFTLAVEATRLFKEKRGIGRYVRALLPRLVAQRAGLRLVLFVKPRDIRAMNDLVARDAVLRGRAEVRPIRAMRAFDADVAWYPWNVITRAPRTGALVVTIHDVAPVTLPDPRRRAWRKNLRWRLRFGGTARQATMVIADSAFTAAEVERTLGFPADRMRVVLLAADDLAIPPVESDTATLARLGVVRPFLLAVGAADRRKNLPLLTRAMPRIVAGHPEVTLVLAGPRPSARVLADSERWMRTIGFVTDAELVTLYRSAEALLFPSTYEGFGLPVLEAMQLGTPVVGVRASSVSEVGGDAAAWASADDDARFAELVNELLASADVRARMREASLRQAARFSWDDTARRTLEAFDEAAAMARAGIGRQRPTLVQRVFGGI